MDDFTISSQKQTGVIQERPFKGLLELGKKRVLLMNDASAWIFIIYS